MASSSGSGQSKALPRDAAVIISILKDMGLTDFEPQVVTQLLEFTYRYLTTTLDDAKVFAQHASKKMLDTEDIQLAVSLQLDKNFTTPPPRDLLMEVARGKNTAPLPQIKPHCGVRLPPDRYCMTACNFELKSAKKMQSQKMQTIYQTSHQVKPQLKRPLQTVSRTQSMASTPKPVIKFSPGPGSSISSNMSGISITTMLDMDEPPASYIKRKHPDDD